MEIINEADYNIVELINNYSENDEDTIHMLQEFLDKLQEEESKPC